LSTSPPAPRELTLVLVLGLLSAFGPLAIDMYLPAFEEIGRDLGASPTEVGWTLAIYFAGLSIGQLVVGPITDRVGRTRPLRAGLTLFVIGSAGAAMAPSIELLIVARGVQALGGATCAVTSRAVVRDLYRGGEAARMNSRLVLVMGVAPMLAPLLGARMLDLAGWRSIFGVLVAVAAIMLGVTAIALPETAPKQPARVSLLATLRALIADRGFVGHALVLSLAGAGMFSYITAAPLVYITLHGVSTDHFFWFFGSNAAGYVGCSQLNVRLLRAFRPSSILIGGLVVQAAAGAALVAIAVGGLGLWPTTAALFVFVSSLGLIMPNATMLALEEQGARAGNASAWMGATQFGCAAGASALVSALGDGSLRPIAVIMLSLSLAAGATLAITRRAR
jgi:DHA1 family bicyclomycin/chloramphenicol resistance-like MFS transporter